ncbi:guanylate kinase [Clostridium sp. C105KSO13]|nr:guanylate kinase [Clostridium sp. C105KSO13]
MPDLKKITPYTTRPAREGEINGIEYYFVDEQCLEEMEHKGIVIEVRAYNTKYGVWKYFTADDGQIDLSRHNYIVIGTLKSYAAMCRYFAQDRLIPVYIEVEDGLRLKRALQREQRQNEPKYSEMCRRFLADQADFSDKNLDEAGIKRRFKNYIMEECLEDVCIYLKEQLTEA